MASSNIILNAARIAAYFHRDQLRDSNGRPYDTHLIRVSGRVLTRPWATEDDGAISWLHDIDEDIGFKQPEIRFEIERRIVDECGVRVWEGVLLLTNPSLGSRSKRAERKAMDREHLKKCPQNIKAIKIIDRTDNLWEYAMDVQLGIEQEIAFPTRYCEESQLLLDECLRGVDEPMEVELQKAIDNLRAICAVHRSICQTAPSK